MRRMARPVVRAVRGGNSGPGPAAAWLRVYRTIHWSALPLGPQQAQAPALPAARFGEASAMPVMPQATVDRVIELSRSGLPGSVIATKTGQAGAPGTEAAGATNAAAFGPEATGDSVRYARRATAIIGGAVARACATRVPLAHIKRQRDNASFLRCGSRRFRSPVILRMAFSKKHQYRGAVNTDPREARARIRRPLVNTNPDCPLVRWFGPVSLFAFGPLRPTGRS